VENDETKGILETRERVILGLASVDSPSQQAEANQSGTKHHERKWLGNRLRKLVGHLRDGGGAIDAGGDIDVLGNRDQSDRAKRD